jgi:hypothetical protein
MKTSSACEMLTGYLDKVCGERPDYSNLSPEIDGGSRVSIDLSINGAGQGNACDASGRERHAKTGRHETHESWPLRCILNNVGMKAIVLAAGDRSVKGQRPHAPGKKDKRLFPQISDTQLALTGESMNRRKNDNITFFK